MCAYTGVYCSSPPFFEERLLLRDLLRLPPDFLLPLRDFLLPLRLRLPAFLLGAAFLRDPRLFGAMVMKGLRLGRSTSNNTPERTAMCKRGKGH